MSLLSLSASSMIADIAGWVLQFLSGLHNFVVAPWKFCISNLPIIRGKF